jgi:hypothetical protein
MNLAEPDEAARERPPAPKLGRKKAGDLGGSNIVSAKHVAEAVKYHCLDWT